MRFADLRHALATGYAPHRPGREAVKPYFNPTYVTDGRMLDPTWPEGLLYAHTAREPVLVAAVYLMNRAGEPGRAVGGCLTHWHVHDKHMLERPGQGDDHRRAHAERPLPAWTDRMGGAADAAHLGE